MTSPDRTAQTVAAALTEEALGYYAHELGGIPIDGDWYEIDPDTIRHDTRGLPGLITATATRNGHPAIALAIHIHGTPLGELT